MEVIILSESRVLQSMAMERFKVRSKMLHPTGWMGELVHMQINASHYSVSWLIYILMQRGSKRFKSSGLICSSYLLEAGGVRYKTTIWETYN